MATKTSAGLEPIDRLEEKIKLLVNTIVRLKGDQTRVTDENARLQKEVEPSRRASARPRPRRRKCRPCAKNATSSARAWRRC